MQVKEDFFARGLSVFVMVRTRDSPLSHQHPPLYNFVQRKEVLVAHVMAKTPLNIAFRKALIGRNGQNGGS
jgi:hypothetical protein